MTMPTTTASNTASESAESTRVFVGNMNYQTKESEIFEFVAKNFAVPKSCKLVFRGPRSLGFAFVEFETPAQATQCISALNGKELDERKLNVQLATTPEKSSGSSPRRTSRRSRGRRGRRIATQNRGPASDTVIFLGNLPYNCTDSDLKEFFGKTVPVTEARVVCFKSGKSKGFGFITAADHDSQKKIIEEYLDAEIDQRKIIVRAAFSEEPHSGEPEATEAEN